MMNKLVLLGILSSFVGIGLSVMLVMSSNENLEQSNKKLEDAKSKVEVIITRAIQHCNDVDNLECNQIMIEWYEECQKPEMKIYDACTNGEINQYVNKFKPYQKQLSYNP